MAVKLKVADRFEVVGMYDYEPQRGAKCQASFRGKACNKVKSPHFCQPRMEKANLAFSKMRLWQPPYTGEPLEPISWARRFIDMFLGVYVWDPEWEEWVQRYQQPVLCLPRRHGKTTIAAGLINYYARTLPPGSKLAIAAQDKERTEGGIADHFYKIYEHSQELWHPHQMEFDTGNRVYRVAFAGEVINTTEILLVASRKPGNIRGPNIAVFVADEYAFMDRADELIENTVKPGFGNLSNHILIRLSTPSPNLASYERQLVKRITTEVIPDPDADPLVLPFIYQMEPWENPGDEKVWKRVAPMLDAGIIKLSKYRQEWKDAQSDPEKMAAFMTDRLCYPQDMVKGFCSTIAWNDCVGVDENTSKPHNMYSVQDKLRELPNVYAGIDMAQSHDFVALSLVGYDTEENLLYITTYGWVPEQVVPTLNKLLSGNIHRWLDSGVLSILPSETEASDTIIAKEFLQILSTYPGCSVVAEDPYEALIVEQGLLDAGYEVRRVKQNPQTVHMGINSLRNFILKRRLVHGGHDLLGYNVRSAQVKTDINDRCRIIAVQDREKDSRRIDNIVAGCLAERERIVDGSIGGASTLLKPRGF